MTNLVSLAVALALLPRPKVDEHAAAILRRMADHLAGLPSFRVHVAATDEVVTGAGEKLQFVTRWRVEVKRPDRLRSDRDGPIAELTLRYDGTDISVYARRTGYYATARAPGSIDAVIDLARDAYGLEAPAADLLFSRPYDVLMADVVSGSYIDLEPLGDVQAHHLAFRGREVDWQIWVQDGPEPLPLRYVVIAKQERGAPQFTAELSRWQPGAQLPDEDFRFTPPPEATRIELLGGTVVYLPDR
jgi:hypothetical protein